MEFVVLPDHPAGAEALALALTPGLPCPTVIEHRSGRPWIVGDWRTDEIMSVAAGPRRLVLLGCATTQPDALAARLGRVRSLADLDDLARLIAGSFHLVASLGGGVRVQGTLSTACQVFYATVAGVTVAADRPETLAGASARASTGNGWRSNCWRRSGLPAAERGAVWRGVVARPSGTALRSAERRRPNPTWWTPPEPELPLGDGGRSARRDPRRRGACCGPEW